MQRRQDVFDIEPISLSDTELDALMGRARSR
jgi:hypothetical protein